VFDGEVLSLPAVTFFRVFFFFYSGKSFLCRTSSLNLIPSPTLEDFFPVPQSEISTPAKREIKEEGFPLARQPHFASTSFPVPLPVRVSKACRSHAGVVS